MVAFFLAAFTACGGDDPAGPGGGGGGGGGGTTPVATTAVNVANFSFSPSAITVAPGATVTWTWVSGTHNVTFGGGEMTSTAGNMSSGTHAAAAPATAGTYNYSCTLHPGMTGTVQVQ